MFPSLVNCNTIDWFLPWPVEALTSVAHSFFESIDMEQNVKNGIVELCCDMQSKVALLAETYLKEMRRY
jgi:dynein heavy chain